METEIRYLENHLEVSVTTSDYIEKLWVKRNDIVALNMQAKIADGLKIADSCCNSIFIHVKHIPNKFIVMFEKSSDCEAHYSRICEWIYCED